MEKVTVIIPVYNVEKYIVRCLESVLYQTYKNIEIICVDDCGTDASMDIVRQYRERFEEKIHIVTCPRNQGLGAARDLGMESAVGDYVTFLDSDDYLEQNCIQKYVDAIKQENAELVIGGYIRVKDEKFISAIPKNKYEDVWLYSSSCHKMYKSSFLKMHGINFRGVRRYEDEQFTYRVLIAKPKIALINYAGYYYVYNNNSITQNKKRDRSVIFLEYIKLILKFYKEVIDMVSTEDQEIFKYCILSKLIACFLYNAQGCGIKRISVLYKEYDDAICLMFGKRVRNSYLTFRKKLADEDIKTHYATWAVMFFRKFKMDKVLFWIDSKM